MSIIPSQFLLHTIRTVSNQIKREHDFRLSEAKVQSNVKSGPGLTGHQFGIMEYIHKHSSQREVYQKDIESAFHMGKSTVSTLLKVLEDNGYLIRTASEHDGRLKKLIPTELAVESRELARVVSAELTEQLTEDISEEEILAFVSTARKLLVNLEKHERATRD
ncbi:MAG: winged helix-turn-helix transcriptional regulator [Anaerofustis stercorihominis]|nr:winged helix-turn-helix transcriptional regulator [Anaerofustis stercorihominis]